MYILTCKTEKYSILSERKGERASVFPLLPFKAALILPGHGRRTEETLGDRAKAL